MTQKEGFPGVVQFLPHHNCLHLSSSVGERYYIPNYFPKRGSKEEKRELISWFGEDVAKQLLKLQPNEGIHIRLVPQITELTSEEIEIIAEHNCASRNLVTLDILKNRK